MLNIEVLISLNLCAVAFLLFISFAFPLLRKSISVKEDYKVLCTILSRGQIESAAVFFRIHDEWLRKCQLT